MTAAALEWTYNPWRERPGRASATLVAALACCALATSFGLPALVALVMCVASLATFAVGFVPVRCRLDQEGVTRRAGWLAERRPWKDLQRAVRLPDAVLLSPFRRRHWLDAYRGLLLPLPARPEDGLADDVNRRLVEHGL